MEKENKCKPPKHLSPTMRAWVLQLLENYDFLPHEFAVVVKAAESWDLCERCRVVVAKEGPTYMDRFGSPRVRPETNILRDAKIAFVRHLAFLNLSTDEEPADEPARHPRVTTPRSAGVK